MLANSCFEWCTSWDFIVLSFYSFLGLIFIHYRRIFQITFDWFVNIWKSRAIDQSVIAFYKGALTEKRFYSNILIERWRVKECYFLLSWTCKRTIRSSRPLSEVELTRGATDLLSLRVSCWDLRKPWRVVIVAALEGKIECYHYDQL